MEKKGVDFSSYKERFSQYLDKLKEDKRKMAATIATAAAIVIVIALFCFGFSAERSLHGLWSVDGVTKYRFEKDGVGALVVPAADYPFTYKVEDDVVYIDFNNPSLHDATYYFKVKGAELTLDDYNSAAIYTLTKE